MPEDLMRYDVLTQEALRGVVKAALAKVAASGLPGEHHFFIAFNTRADGVQMSERLRQRYPREMTIVLQHQFYNLNIRDDAFEVELSFNEIPERLVVPFAALKGFLDPSVQFGLQFEAMQVGEAPAMQTDAQQELAPVDKGESKTAETSAEEAEEAKVVSLDAFRKK
jgi:uncharacterized protein